MMTSSQAQAWVVSVLEDLKAKEILVLDVKELTSVTDAMIPCSGTSTRHVQSLAEYLVLKAKEAGIFVFGMEGEAQGEWVLVDLVDVVVHIMLPKTREFYSLERLWDMKPLKQVVHQ